MAERLTYLPPEAQGMTEEESQMREAIGHIGKDKTGEWDHFTPDFVGTKAQEFDVRQASEQMDRAREMYWDARISQPEGRIKLGTDLPISIFFVGDVHLGSIYTDQKRFLREIERIRVTPNAYIIFMGNLIDNAIPSQFPSNMLANSLTPDKQVIWMRRIIQGLSQEGKVLGGITSPCHEGWTAKHTGQDVNALIYGFPERKFPVLENGGLLHLEMAKAEYTIALYHQVGPFESNFNETHALRQLNRLNLQMKGDIVAGAHRHFAAAEMVFEGTGESCRPVAYIRTGTYKGLDKYRDMFSVDRYGATGEPTGQAVEVWPNQRKMATFLEFNTAIIAHESFYLTELAKKENIKL